MPQPASAQPSPRPAWRRRAAAMAVCGAAGVALSCEGDCPPQSTQPVAPPPTVALATRYVLVQVNGAPLPRVIRQDPDGTIVRVFADTLTLAPGGTAERGTYDEVAVLGTIRPGQVEVVERLTATGRAYARQPYNGLQVAAGVVLPGQANGGVLQSGAAASRTQLTLFHQAAGSLLFESR